MPVGTVYYPNAGLGPIYPNARKILAVSRVGGVEVEPYAEYKFGETNKEDWFRAKFPLGKVPAFESGKGDFKLWESEAIAWYIASISPKADQLLRSSSPEASAKVHQWLFFSACHLFDTTVGLALWRYGFAEYEAAKEEKCWAELERWTGYMEGQLEGKKWLVDGDEATLADFTVAGVFAIGLLQFMDKEFRAKYPTVFAWYERVAAIPALGDLYKVDWIEKKRVDGQKE